MAYQYDYSVSGVIPINTDIQGPTEVYDSRSIQLRVLSLGTTGVLTVQGSEDGTTYNAIPCTNANGAVVNTITAIGMYVCPVYYKYIRVRLTTATTAGKTVVSTRLSTDRYVAPAPTIATQPVSLAALPALVAGSAVVGQTLPSISATLASGPTLLYHRLLSAAASTNATSVKGSAGRVVLIRGYNAKASVCYLKLYNKATAPTVGTDVPVMTIALKASDVFNVDVTTLGLNFSTGIAYACTGAVADADTTALVAADIVGLNIVYI